MAAAVLEKVSNLGFLGSLGDAAGSVKDTVSDKITGFAKEQSESVIATTKNLTNMFNKRKYGRLHEQLVERVVKTGITASALTNAPEVIEQHEARYADALGEGNQALADEIKVEIDALNQLHALMAEGEGTSLMEQVLDREAMDSNDARKTILFMETIANHAQTISESQTGLRDDIGLSLGDILNEQIKAISDTRISGDFRFQLAEALNEQIEGIQLFRDGSGAQILRETLESIQNDSLDDDESTNKIIKALEFMSDKVDNASAIHSLSDTLMKGEQTSEAMQADLRKMVGLMANLDGFSEEQTKLAEATNNFITTESSESKEQLDTILHEISDRTVQSETLQNITELNRNFSESVTNEEEMREALELNALKEEFTDNSELVSTAGNAFEGVVTSTLMSVLSNIPGVNPMVGEAIGAGVGMLGLGGIGGIGGGIYGLFQRRKRKMAEAKGTPDEKKPKPAKPGIMERAKGLKDKVKLPGKFKFLSRGIQWLSGLSAAKKAAVATGTIATIGGTTYLLSGDDSEEAYVVTPEEYENIVALGGQDAIALDRLAQTELQSNTGAERKQVIGETGGSIAGMLGARLTGDVPEGGVDGVNPISLAKGTVGIAAGAGATYLGYKALQNRGILPTQGQQLPPRDAKGRFTKAPITEKVAGFDKFKAGAKTAGKVASKALGPAAVALEAGMGIHDYTQAESGAERKQVIGETGGSIAGMLGGAKLGMMVGAFGGPIGIATGALLGGVAGSIAGSTLGSKIADFFTSDEDYMTDEQKAQMQSQNAVRAADQNIETALGNNRRGRNRGAFRTEADLPVNTSPIDSSMEIENSGVAESLLESEAMSVAMSNREQARGTAGQGRNRIKIPQQRQRATRTPIIPSQQVDDYGIALANAMLFS